MTKNFDNFVFEILMESSFNSLPENPPYGFWISPEGEIYKVLNFMDHEDVAASIVRNENLTKEYFLLHGKYGKEFSRNNFLRSKKYIKMVQTKDNEYTINLYSFDFDEMKRTGRVLAVNFQPTSISLKTAKDICTFYNFECNIERKTF
jgi:hypothetical protein